MPRTYSTRHPSNFPAYNGEGIIVNWTEDEDYHGFSGEVTHYKHGAQSDCTGHSVLIRLGSPLGSVIVTLDQRSYGCYRTMEFEGTDINLRDLQWATLWAGLAIELKHGSSFKDFCKNPKDKLEPDIDSCEPGDGLWH